MYRILSRHKFCLNFITKFLTFKTFILDLRQILDLRPFVKPFVNSQKNSHHSVPQFMKVRCKKDIDMGKMKMDMCPFTYWRTREIISEFTGVVNVIKVWRQKNICIGKI